MVRVHPGRRPTYFPGTPEPPYSLEVSDYRDESGTSCSETPWNLPYTGTDPSLGSVKISGGTWDCEWVSDSRPGLA